MFLVSHLSCPPERAKISDTVQYNGFISYSRVADGSLASAVRTARHRMRVPLRAAISIWSLLLVLVVGDVTLLRATSFHPNHAAVLYALGQATGQDYQTVKEGYEKRRPQGTLWR